MVSAKKASTTKPASKKSAAKAAQGHPTWVDMIKECIANSEDARIGVSRPQIKKYVESAYQLEIGAAQATQLSKAITSGELKGIFVLPKGPSGRVKLAPKSKSTDAATKENKPTSRSGTKIKSATTKPATKPATKPVSKARTTKAATAKPRSSTTKKAPVKKAETEKPKATTVKKPAVKKTVAKTKAKTTTTPKKTTAPSKRGTAKKSVTGTSSTTKAKTAARKAPAKRVSPTKKEVAKPAAKTTKRAASRKT